MRQHLVPLAVTLSLSLATVALAQSGGGSGGGAGGGGASGGASAGAASSGAAGAAGATSGSSGVAAPATPPASVSPSTEDVAGASRVPRARSGPELGVPQPGDASAGTTGSVGSSSSSVVSPGTVDRQGERDRSINRSLIQGGGICDGCSANPPAAR
jgi:hypothetical protein